jgi:hypothetical protein
MTQRDGVATSTGGEMAPGSRKGGDDADANFTEPKK